MFGIGFTEWFLIIFVAGMVFLFIVAISNGGKNNPTWPGIIISFLLNTLLLYLFLCFIGVMGEPRYQREDPYD